MTSRSDHLLSSSMFALGFAVPVAAGDGLSLLGLGGSRAHLEPRDASTEDFIAATTGDSTDATYDTQPHIVDRGISLPKPR